MIHFIWVGCEPPEVVKFIVESWKRLNPDYEVFFHGEEILSHKYLDIYNRVTDFCSKSDLLRYSVLERYGGWYFDCDFMPLRPMSDICRDLKTDVYLTQQWERERNAEKYIANGIIGISKDSEVWDYIDSLIFESASKPLERTSFGPPITTKVVENMRDKVTVSEVGKFYPVPYKHLAMPLFNELNAGNFSDEIIKDKFGDDVPYCLHLWMGGDY